jgi:hypothetical protein
MTPAFPKRIFSHPVRNIVLAIVGGLFLILFEALLSRGLIREFNFLEYFGLYVMAIYFCWFFVALGQGAVALLNCRYLAMRLHVAIASIIAICIVTSIVVSGDRSRILQGPHGEIAEIYKRRKLEFDQNTSQVENSSPRLVRLDQQCRPPQDCECWILLDPAHTSGVEKDIGGWHRPKASVFPQNGIQVRFALVAVRQINSDSYSVLGCPIDWSLWNPV